MSIIVICHRIERLPPETSILLNECCVIRSYQEPCSEKSVQYRLQSLIRRPTQTHSEIIYWRWKVPKCCRTKRRSKSKLAFDPVQNRYSVFTIKASKSIPFQLAISNPGQKDPAVYTYFRLRLPKNLLNLESLPHRNSITSRFWPVTRYTSANWTSRRRYTY